MDETPVTPESPAPPTPAAAAPEPTVPAAVILPAELAHAPPQVLTFFRKLPALVLNTRRRSWRALIEVLVEARVVAPAGSCGCSKPIREGRGRDPFSVWVHQNHELFRTLVGRFIPYSIRYAISEGIERYLSSAERSHGYYAHELVRPLQDWLIAPVEPDLARRFHGLSSEVLGPSRKRPRRGKRSPEDPPADDDSAD